MSEEERIALWGDLVPTITSKLGQLALEGNFLTVDFIRNIMSHAEKKVIEEREECAKVAAWLLKMPQNDISAAILARGQV